MSFVFFFTVLIFPLSIHILTLVISANQLSPSLYNFHLYNFHFNSIISGVHKSRATEFCTLGGFFTVLIFPFSIHILTLVISANQLSPSLYNFHLYNFHFNSIISGVHKFRATEFCTLGSDICGWVAPRYPSRAQNSEVACIFLKKIWTHLYYLYYGRLIFSLVSLLLRQRNRLMKSLYNDTSANEDNSFRNHIR